VNILFTSSEVYPLIKTGGLADVAYNLPKALKNLHQSVRILMPAYSSVLKKLSNSKVLNTIQLKGESVKIIETQIYPSRLKVWLIDCPPYFDRPGNPYVNEQGQDWHDNALRFGFFCEVAALIATNQLGLKWQADIVHCNDWQSGLIPVYLQTIISKKPPKTIFTIHNLAYQGLFPYSTFTQLHLPDNLWSPEGLEYYGQMSFIKGGLVFADTITTVSPRYAEEILTPEFGCGLEGLLQHRQHDLVGIINGIDEREWNPAKDVSITQHYNSRTLPAKSDNKQALQTECGFTQKLANGKQPLLIGMVTRLSEQKGIDLLIDSIPALTQLPIQLVILGSGDLHYENTLHAAAKKYPDKIHVITAYDESLAHRIIAGADIFLMPSRYEPCGLTQLYSLRYGTLPLVRAVGGLANTVVNSNDESINNLTATGFSFTEENPLALQQSVKYALACFAQNSLWKKIQLTAMKKDFSWKKSAQHYLQLYQEC